MQQRFFIRSAGAILLVAALTRFIIAAGSAQALSLPDPMLGIPLRYALLLVGALELFVAVISLFGKRPGLQSAWLAWLATDYVASRVGLLVMNCDAHATCIGALTDPLHLAGGVTGFLAALLTTYLLAGSLASLTVSWDLARATVLNNPPIHQTTSFSPSIQQSTDPLIQSVRSTTPLSRSSNNPRIQQPNNPAFVQLACPRCLGHIEFPTHALGATVPCPHCKMNITLQTPT